MPSDQRVSELALKSVYLERTNVIPCYMPASFYADPMDPLVFDVCARAIIYLAAVCDFETHQIFVYDLRAARFFTRFERVPPYDQTCLLTARDFLVKSFYQLVKQF